MNLRQIALEDQPPPKRLFAVLGWGCSGSKWLAHVLNDLPGVFCIHEGRPVWDLFAAAKPLEGHDYLKMAGLLGSAASAAGDVSSLSPYEIDKTRFELGGEFAVVSLTRNPFDRLWTYLELARRYNMGSGDEERLRLGTRMLNTIIEESAVANVVRMEDLISDPAALIETAYHLTDVMPSTEWVTSSMSLPRVNHRAPEGWFTQQQLGAIVDGLSPQAAERYTRLGYALEEAA